MKKIISLAFLACALTGCLQKIPIIQGNIITPEDVSRLHVGMGEEQVKDIMGTPVLINLFTPNRAEYVYTYALGSSGRRCETRLTLIFINGRLREIIRYV